MKLVFLCALFAPIVYCACRQKKWYLYLIMAFVGILPEQFAVRVHSALPLLSGTRVLILILAVYWLYDKWKTKTFYLPKSLLLFLGINIFISILNLRYGADELKRIFLLVFERVFLVIMIADMIDTREEFENAVDFMIMGCAALAVIGIIQTIFEYDIASVMHLTTTMASIQLERRMNMMRAYGSFNAITYGCYCAFMILPISYRLGKTGKQRYGFALALDIVALICTFTRSAWLGIGVVFLVLIIVRRRELFRKLLPSAGFVIMICVALCLVQPRFFSALVETQKSAINTVLSIIPEELIPDQPQTTPDKNDSSDKNDINDKNDKGDNAPQIGFELSEDFGINGEDPSYSRMAQWTAVDYMAREGKLLLGYGYNALPEGKLHFYFDRWQGKWESTTFLDVGMVALITESGLVGALTSFALLCYILIVALKRRNRTNGFDVYRVTLYVIPLFLLLNFLASFMFDHIVWLFIAMFYAYYKLDTRDLLADTPKLCEKECQ